MQLENTELNTDEQAKPYLLPASLFSVEPLCVSVFRSGLSRQPSLPLQSPKWWKFKFPYGWRVVNGVILSNNQVLYKLNTKICKLNMM